jgi:predicted nuclease with TOPRIM domain
MLKTDIRKSQSFTYSEVTVGIEIMRFAMRSNDLKVLSQRPDFISLYRKFSRMRDKMDEVMAEKEAARKSE